MLVLLPPSETKVSGGEPGSRLDWGRLSFRSQDPVRASLVDQLIALARDTEASRKALKLGPQGDPEIARNRELLASPVLPALQRYTGVLYDALDFASLPEAAKRRASNHVAVGSALFGIIRASDPIPAYRLSWDSRLPAGTPKAQWKPSAQSVWDEIDAFVLDLRSEGYRSFQPAPADRGVWVNLVAPGPSGARRPIGHANKASKGLLVRSLLLDRARIESVDDLVGWGRSAGWNFDPVSATPGEIDLVISGS